MFGQFFNYRNNPSIMYNPIFNLSYLNERGYYYNQVSLQNIYSTNVICTQSKIKMDYSKSQIFIQEQKVVSSQYVDKSVNQKQFAEQKYEKFQKNEELDISFSRSNDKFYDKNTESNISNQIFSFISNPNRSLFIIQKLLRSNNASLINKKTKIFYFFMKIIKRKTKKYLNKKFLLALCEGEPSNTLLKQVSKKKKKLQILNFVEFAKITRIMIQYFLNNECIIGIITSKKIDPENKVSHFSRKRLIKNYLDLNMTQL